MTENNTEQPTPATFILKLHSMLSEQEFYPYLAWSRDGTTLVLRNTDLLAKNVLPKYFKHNNLASFVRQLNSYGFRKTDSSINQSCSCCEAECTCSQPRMEFRHEKFVREKPELIREITRQKTPSRARPTTSSSPSPTSSSALPSPSIKNNNTDLISNNNNLNTNNNNNFTSTSLERATEIIYVTPRSPTREELKDEVMRLKFQQEAMLHQLTSQSNQLSTQNQQISELRLQMAQISQFQSEMLRIFSNHPQDAIPWGPMVSFPPIQHNLLPISENFGDSNATSSDDNSSLDNFDAVLQALLPQDPDPGHI
eukprot:TRINITY_DN3245_c0_g1_i1.p1 TRINITY_DN3245_c0_g1~~TRINITY_DN3245_c0_g1_i1.p1  ORF type:complete len:311 (-),score=55.00 TRINITY_DN3245_c0_g1_i1:883-1815(-)